RFAPAPGARRAGNPGSRRAVRPWRQGPGPPGATEMTRDTAGSRHIGEAFANARANGCIAFVPYVVAGYPDIANSEAAALAVLDAGADLLEIGLPYSDPLADGVTLQRASAAALANGATLDRSFDL